MAEDNNGKEPPGGRGFLRLCLVLPWVLVLVIAVVVQVQFVLLQSELTAIKLHISLGKNSTAEDERRILAKRSSGEGDNAVKKVSGFDAAHFRGKFPFQKIETDGRIGPWSLSSQENAFVELKAKNTEFEFTTKGIYFVYAQIYYFTKEPPNSYQILSYNGTEERKNHRVLSTCAGQGSNVIGEVSCYTGFTGIFNRGHRLYLHQIEQNRIINNSNGCSFFGVVLLKRTANPRRKT